MAIEKIFTSRSNANNINTFVGQEGQLFYDPQLGLMKRSDGVTPGGVVITFAVPVASTSTLGGVKSGPGVNIGNDGTITIDAAGLPISFGDFTAIENNLSTVNVDQDMNLVSNGTGTIQLVGKFSVHPTSLGLASPGIFRVDADGKVTMLAPGSTSTTGAVKIIGSTGGEFQTPVNTGVMLQITGIPPQSGVPVPSRIYNDAQGAYSGWVARRYNGTAASPTKVLANEEIARFVANGYTGDGWKLTGAGRVSIYANENQESNAQGGRIEMWACPNGSAAQEKIVTVDGTGMYVTGTSVIKSLSLLAGTTTTSALKFSTGTTLTLALPGAVEYNGVGIYFTPIDSERGILPSEQLYRLNTDRTFTPGVTTPVSLFGVGPHVSANRTYHFRIEAFVTRDAGGNNQTMSLAWDGTAGITKITYSVLSTVAVSGVVGTASLIGNTVTTNFTNPVIVTTPANQDLYSVIITGIVDIGTQGTLVPMIGWSAIPGNVTVFAPSMMKIYPIGTTGTNTVIGSWS